MQLDEKTVIRLDQEAEFLAAQFDVAITQYVQRQEDEETIPFVVLAAVAAVITKLAVVTSDTRDSLLAYVRDMIPEDEAIKALRMVPSDDITSSQLH